MTTTTDSLGKWKVFYRNDRKRLSVKKISNLIWPNSFEHTHRKLGQRSVSFRNNRIQCSLLHTNMHRHAKIAHCIRQAIFCWNILAMVENQWEHSTRWMRSLYKKPFMLRVHNTLCKCEFTLDFVILLVIQAETHHLVCMCMRYICMLCMYRTSNKLWETLQKSYLIAFAVCAKVNTATKSPLCMMHNDIFEFMVDLNFHYLLENIHIQWHRFIRVKLPRSSRMR